MPHAGTYMKAGYTLALSHGTFPDLRPSLRKKKCHILKMKQKLASACTALKNDFTVGWHKYFCQFEGF